MLEFLAKAHCLLDAGVRLYAKQFTEAYPRDVTSLDIYSFVRVPNTQACYS